jgi:dipeptidyl aminopeptidase/acylaminoacyl peptidase
MRLHDQLDHYPHQPLQRPPSAQESRICGASLNADIPGFLPDYFGGEAWDVFEAFRQHSPMAFVKNVRTPTLILHGEADVRVPTSQGYELYNALKRQGVTTKMVVYPRTPHGPREPKFILDIAQRHLDWVDKYAR